MNKHGAIQHILSQPFILATGVAALFHSTWSIATYFSGPEPASRFSLEWLSWAGVAFLIAFSMDVGQIVTSSELREGRRTRARYLTFGVFALGTYYAQFLYISSHMPIFPMAAGIRPEWAGFVQLVRDAACFILHALLPAATLLYTFSYDGETDTPALPEPAPEPLTIEPPSRALIVAEDVTEMGGAGESGVTQPLTEPVTQRTEIGPESMGDNGTAESPLSVKRSRPSRRPGRSASA